MKVFRSRFEPIHRYKTVNESSQSQSITGTAHFGRPGLDDADLVGCVLSLAAVTRLKLPDMSAGEVQYSCHTADTVMLLEPPEAVAPTLNRSHGGIQHIC